MFREDVFFVLRSNQMAHIIMKMSATADRGSGTYLQKVQVQGNDTDIIQFTQKDWNIRSEKAPKGDAPMTENAPKTIEPDIRGCFLPNAFQSFIPQLLDLKKPATYGFAVYSPVVSAFDVWTLTIIGASKVDIGGKEVKAYQIDFQTAEDAPHSQIYLDEKGRLLRSFTDGGLVVEYVDKETFFKAFPKTADLIGKD